MDKDGISYLEDNATYSPSTHGRQSNWEVGRGAWMVSDNPMLPALPAHAIPFSHRHSFQFSFSYLMDLFHICSYVSGGKTER